MPLEAAIVFSTAVWPAAVSEAAATPVKVNFTERETMGEILNDRQVISDATDQAANLKKKVGEAEEAHVPNAEASSHSAADSKSVKPPCSWGPRKFSDGSISGDNSLRSNKTGPQSLMQTLSQVFAEPGTQCLSVS
ncbi:hypothetical protein B484DRAFT_389418 [Ochromonadaceae sp. CCMP2298]|nr:hypothetical protein B484DRAFT_389418 [Ochromonadaceae sp. CCMP2298]